MSKAVVLASGAESFFVETDESVELAPGAKVHVTVPAEGIAEGLEGVVDIKDIERQFSDVRNLMVTCCKGLFEVMADIPKPERFAIEFGVKLAGEAGVPMVTKASGEANFKVSIEWKK